MRWNSRARKSMAAVSTVCLLVAALFVTGCADYSDIVALELYVDAANGDDNSATGSAASPYKTITKAVTESAGESANIHILPGTYDTALGEIFPLVLQGKVNLLGAGTDASAVIISGSGNYTSTSSVTVQAGVVLKNTNRLDKLTISTGLDVGSFIDGSAAQVRISNSRLVDNGIGVLIENSTGGILYGNVIQNNDTGVVVQTGATAGMRKNLIDTNRIGVYIDNTSEADVGTQQSVGNNTIGSNTQCDLVSDSGTDIYALGNIWDDNEFAFTLAGSCSAGANVVATGTGTVYYQFIPSNSAVIFPNTSLIPITTPTFGQQINTDSPLMSWTATGNSLVLAAIFNRPIIVSGRHIVNTEDIVWLWHSGLGNANEGYVLFNNGVSILNGDIEQTALPQILEIGRTYYWLVMAWDVEGTTVSHSSYQNYFITIP